MGQEGAGQIANLARASDAELKKFVAAWQRAQGAVKTSARFNWTQLVQFIDDGAHKLLDIYNQARDQLDSFVFDSLNKFTEMSRSSAEAIGNAFGQIFQGPMNISDHIGPAFDSAMDSYASSMAGLQDQMLELQQRQADTISDFMKRRRDELKQAFGQLFSGPILSEGFAAGSIRDLQADLEKQLSAFNDWRASLDKLAARGIPKQLLKDLEALGPDAKANLALLANASDEELGKYVETWKNAQTRIEEVTQATFMDQEGFAEAMADIAKQMADVMKQMSQLQAPKRADFAMLLGDLQAQKDAWTDYNSILSNLQARGVPGLLLAQLAELGVDGVEILRILNNSSAAELQTYVALWISAQDQIKKAKADWMKAMNPDEILTGLSDQVTALETWEAALQSLAQRGVPKEIIRQLREMGPEALPLLQGLVTMTDDQLFGEDGFVNLWKRAHDDINTSAVAFVDTQVALWREQGSKIAAGLIAGVLDEQDQLLKFFRNMFKNLLDEARKETKSHSPSEVYYALGVDIVQGFQQGLNSMTTKLKTPQAPTIGRGTVAGGLLASGQPGINMTVNAHHSESLSTTLERASFRMRQRRVS